MKEQEEIYALFILASNHRLKILIKDCKEYPEEFDTYSPIRHAKEFKFQWIDR